MSAKTATQAAEAAETKNVTETEVPVTRCYVGPTASGIVHGTIYNAGLPPLLEKAIKAKPVISNLVVPIGELAEANRALDVPNSAMRRFYSIAEEYFQNEKGGK